MKNYIVIDAGHGGDDSGAVGNNIIEKDLTLKISQYMYDQLKKLNIPVTMTRTTDETLSPEKRVERIMSAYGNNNDVIVISNHINAGGGDGAEVIYALRNNNVLSNLILNNIKSSGQNVREAYQRRLPSDTSKDYYFIHRETGLTQPVIIEYGFLDSTLDDPLQLKNNYKTYAQDVVDGVLEYIGYETISDNLHIVQSGDTLWSLAKKYSITVDALKEANSLITNSLSLGQKLIIPIQSQTKDVIYTVKSGDNLYSIAKLYNVNVNDIVNKNNLTTNNLYIGQILTIPTFTEIETNYQEYKVQSGDTLYSIAKKYNLTLQQLINYNDLTSQTLTVNQIIKIPVATESQNYILYTVKSGDNLYSIARSFDLTTTEIMKYNNLTTNLLDINQTLKIPRTSNLLYQVQSGDTLYSIAKKYNTTVDQIKSKNNLATNSLEIGQKLLI
ncbi:MAG: LysM peptidoglycan-binding domain-containing protein [Bacilli bacterium]|nr:LysM peptidoglycan-binding domain-containing protein [Bacilli bacterium]